MEHIVIGWMNVLIFLYGLTALVGGVSHSLAPIYRVDLIWWDALTFLVKNVRKNCHDLSDTSDYRENAEYLLKKFGYTHLPELLKACSEWEAGIFLRPLVYGYSDRIKAKEYAYAVREELINQHRRYQHQKAQKKAYQSYQSRGNTASGQSSQNGNPFHSAAPSPNSWRKVLGLPEGECNPFVIKLAARKLIRKNHPDHGGKGDKIYLYTKALDEAKAELGFK